MMSLICLECGNYVYFTTDVQVFKAVRPTREGLLLEDALFDEFNWTNSSIRDELQDNVDYCIRASKEVLQFNIDTGHYENTLIACGRCSSKRVTPPYSEWRPRRPLKSVHEEILENRKEFKQLREEKQYADKLPVLWQP